MEKIDCISCLLLVEVECLVVLIWVKGVKLVVFGVVDLLELVVEVNGVVKIVLEFV